MSRNRPKGFKKTELKPHLNVYWCIPPKENAAFVACMEDVLDLYQRPYDPNCPLICMDEKPLQLLDHVRTQLPMRPGSVQKTDSEYLRNGTCSIFVFCEPLADWRHVHACKQRTRVDWAEQVRILLEEFYPSAPRIRLVMDNLNTHSVASLYEAFPAEHARRLASRLEIHYTPKHGSWLNIAEIELSVLSQQCLDRRIATIDLLNDQLAAWECSRNHHQKGVVWHFTTQDARVALRSLYPKFL